MGLIDDIKSSAQDNGTKIQSSKEAQFEQLFNELFYAPKNPDEEVAFVKQMFTRGAEFSERKGLHTSAIIVGDDAFCMREQVLSLLFKRMQGEEVPIKLKRIFEEGNAIHEKWQRLFLRGELCKHTDLDYSRMYKKYEVGYTPDAIIEIPEHCVINGRVMDTSLIHGIHVVEIKSVNTYQFQKMHSHPSGEKQLQMYMGFAKIKQGLVLCDDKNTQDFKCFCTTFNKDKILPYVDRLVQVQHYKQRYLDKKGLPKPCKQCKSKLSKRAMQCAMREACFNIGKGRVPL